VLESWTRLAFLAGAYPRFRYGHLVLAQGFRNPALVAKMAASLSELTDGRFVLGLGAGWKEDEYVAYGYGFPDAATRVEQLAESIELIRALWSGEPTTYRGEHFRVEDAVCRPAPSQPIPVLVGARGRRALEVAARLADQWNWDGPWDEYRAPYETLRLACDRIGRPLDSLVLTAQVRIDLTGADRPDGLTVGPTAGRVIDELRRLQDVGVRHVQVDFVNVPTIDRFVDRVLPAFT
jgi:alkanesulfonate monooxygenase SsuD/methylene tetrahydromethanopterin reductase-like flavin-dependent oxidoreductase (luciferase family)